MTKCNTQIYTPEEFFYIPSGDYELATFISQPDNPEYAPIVMFCHGYMGSKSEKNRHFFRLAQKLTQLGFITVRFDFAGCGDSIAPTTAFSIRQGVKDICAVQQFLDDNAIGNLEKFGMVGYSLGSLVVARAIKKLPFVSAICLMAGVEHAILSPEEQVALESSNGDTVWNRGVELSLDFVRDFAVSRGAPFIAETKVPVQLIYASADETVQRDHYEEYKKVLNPASPEPVLIEGADHFFSGQGHQEQIDDVLIGFMSVIRGI